MTLKKILLITIIVVIVICCCTCGGCYEYMFNSGNDEPISQSQTDTVTVNPRPSGYRSVVIENAVKVEDLVVDNHKKRGRIDEMDKQIAALEKEIDRKNNTFSKIAIETDIIKRDVTVIKSVMDSTEQPPESPVTILKPKIQKIEESSDKISLLSKPDVVFTVGPIDVPTDVGPVDVTDVTDATEVPEDNTSYKKILLGAIFGICGLIILIRYVFLRK